MDKVSRLCTRGLLAAAIACVPAAAFAKTWVVDGNTGAAVMEVDRCIVTDTGDGFAWTAVVGDRHIPLASGYKCDGGIVGGGGVGQLDPRQLESEARKAVLPRGVRPAIVRPKPDPSPAP